MHDIEITQSLLKSINPTDYTISIRLRPGGFCFSLYSKTAREFTALYDVSAENIDDVVSKMERIGLRGNEFCQIYVLDDCEKWTLLPANMEGTDQNAVWELNFGLQPAAPLCEADIATAGTKCLFEAGENSLALKKRFTNARLFPIQVADIAYSLQGSQNTEGGFMGLDVRDKQMCLYVANNGKLQLANAFGYETPTDLLYFVMNTLRTFSFKQNEVHVELWGKTPDTTLQLLKQYIRHVSVAEPNKLFDYASNIKKLANKHEYYDLFNITICAL